MAGNFYIRNKQHAEGLLSANNPQRAAAKSQRTTAESQHTANNPQRTSGMRHGIGLRFTAVLLVLCMIMMTALTGCGGSAGSESSNSDASGTSDTGGAPQIAGLTYEEEVPLQRATGFSVYKYEGGYSLIDIHDSQRFLVVPEDGTVPEGLDSDITVLQQPIDKIYLAASATVALFCSMDALDHIRMSSLQENKWSFDEPREAMKKGDIIYAGKYNAPDYETMLDEECDLAVESTMIYHTPEVKEMIEDVDIPVLVDRSSYESDPMGRAEWIKLYATLTGHEKEADEFFNAQMDSIKDLDDFENTGKTIAFFYITSDGKVVARASTDYVPKMIEIAGGKYIFSDLKDTGDKEMSTSVDMSTETFFDTAADADFIVYNASIDSTVQTLDDLINKDPVMKNMKAVKEGNCWATGSSMYQRTDLAAEMILDFHKLLTEDDPEKDLKYITKLK